MEALVILLSISTVALLVWIFKKAVEEKDKNDEIQNPPIAPPLDRGAVEPRPSGPPKSNGEVMVNQEKDKSVKSAKKAKSSK
jgi:hypothetical protein